MIDITKLKIARYPGRLIFRKYEGYSHVWYLDQIEVYDGMPYPENPDDLPDDQFWICSSQITGYLKKYYGLTLQQYFNLVHGYPLNWSPDCSNPNCLTPGGGKCRFINLQRGYTEYCTPNCSSSHHIHQQYNDPDDYLRKRQYEGKTPEVLAAASRRFTEMNEENWANPEYRKMMSEEAQYTINSIDSKIKATYNDFLSKGNLTDKCEFYIGISKDDLEIKYGVTCGLVLQKLWRCNLRTVHVAVRGSRQYIADIERLIKESRNDYNEFLDISELPNIFKLVKSIKSSIIDPYT